MNSILAVDVKYWTLIGNICIQCCMYNIVFDKFELRINSSFCLWPLRGTGEEGFQRCEYLLAKFATNKVTPILQLIPWVSGNVYSCSFDANSLMKSSFHFLLSWDNSKGAITTPCQLLTSLILLYCAVNEIKWSEMEEAPQHFPTDQGRVDWSSGKTRPLHWVGGNLIFWLNGQ